MSKFRQLIQKIEMLKGAPLVGIQGVSEEEIEALTQKLGCPLPESYVDFLRVLGKSLNNLQVFESGCTHYDFSYATIKEYILKESKHNSALLPALLPIGIGAEPDYICLLIDRNYPHLDPPVYLSWASSIQEADPEYFWAYHFSNWMASRLVYTILMKSKKHRFSLEVDTDEFEPFIKFLEFSERENIDQLIYNLLIQLGFVNFLEGVTETVFMQGANTYLIYFRAPNRKTFNIRVVTDQKKLGSTLAKQLNRLLHIKIDIKKDI